MACAPWFALVFQIAEAREQARAVSPVQYLRRFDNSTITVCATHSDRIIGLWPILPNGFKDNRHTLLPVAGLDHRSFFSFA
jgi:hypothetical protein